MTFSARVFGGVWGRFFASRRPRVQHKKVATSAGATDCLPIGGDGTKARFDKQTVAPPAEEVHLFCVAPSAQARGEPVFRKPRMVRWASADLHFFAVFCSFLIGFCGIWIGALARWSSGPEPTHFSGDFSAPLACGLHSMFSPQRRRERRGRIGGKANSKTAQPSPQSSQRLALSERSEPKGRRERWKWGKGRRRRTSADDAESAEGGLGERQTAKRHSLQRRDAESAEKDRDGGKATANEKKCSAGPWPRARCKANRPGRRPGRAEPGATPQVRQERSGYNSFVLPRPERAQEGLIVWRPFRAANNI